MYIYYCFLLFCIISIVLTHLNMCQFAYPCMHPDYSLHCFLCVFPFVVNTGKLSSIPHPPTDSNRKSWAPVIVLSAL